MLILRPIRERLCHTVSYSVTAATLLSQNAMLLPPSGHQTPLLAGAEQLWRSSSVDYDSLFLLKICPVSPLWLVLLLPLLPSHHDRVHNVVLVVFQRTNGFGPRHVGLSHHQLDVPLLQASIVHLGETERELYSETHILQGRVTLLKLKVELRNTSRRLPLLPHLRSPPLW